MKKFILMPMDENRALEIWSWHYEGQYAVYNWGGRPEEAIQEMLDPRSPYYAVYNEAGEFAGYFCFGTSALPWRPGEPSLFYEDGLIDIGLGMRPDLTGKGHGLAFISTGISFAEEKFASKVIRLFVRCFNKRAIRVYEKVGFMPIRRFPLQNIEDPDVFLEMRRHPKALSDSLVKLMDLDPEF